MELNEIKKVHIIGIGGCASSAIAELLCKNGITVTGSEMKPRDGLGYLEALGIKIVYRHDKDNLNLNNIKPDFVLYSPAVFALNPDNPELLEAKKKKIHLLSWEEFIGEYLSASNKTGIFVCGSEGKGTTAGILTQILKGTEFDPLSILGAKIKSINDENDSNIYFGEGSSYILEADEYNRNFLSYHPSIVIMINFKYEHPETYKNFNEYQKAFYKFFKGMNGKKLLILKATKEIANFVQKYKLYKSHSIIWFSKESDHIKDIKINYKIINHSINEKGNKFLLEFKNEKYEFFLSALPGYMVYNTVGAIIASLEIGLSVKQIQKNIIRFKGMVRRFDIYKTKRNGIIITDYGHSPEAINHIIKEIRSIFKNKKIHLIFQPHLFSRTYNFFEEFINALKNTDKVSLIDIYPAREDPDFWKTKVSSFMIFEKLKELKKDVFYAGKSSEIYNNLLKKIDEKDITCFIGAGDMDLYYQKILDYFKAESYY
jgi:UDP-N-acetylmuramate--alanine ligase